MRTCSKCSQWRFFHAYKGSDGSYGICMLKSRLSGIQIKTEFNYLFNDYAYANRKCSLKFRIFMRLIYIFKRLMWRKLCLKKSI